MNKVAQAFVEIPMLSTCCAAWLVDVSDHTVHSAMKEIRLHMYWPRLLQMLTEDNLDYRIQFAEWYPEMGKIYIILVI